jgi:hypothetical protein
MNSRCLIIVAAFASAAALALVAAPVTAQAKTMKECAAEWDKMKAAGACRWSGHRGEDRPSGHDRPRARLRRGVEGRQGGGQDPGRPEMAPVLE